MLRHTYTDRDERFGNAYEHGLMDDASHGMSPEQFAAMRVQQGRKAVKGNKGKFGKALPGHVPSVSGRKLMPAGVHDPTASTIGKGAAQKLAAPQLSQYKAGTNVGGMAPRTKAGNPILPKVPQLKAPQASTAPAGAKVKPPKAKKLKGKKGGGKLEKAKEQLAETRRVIATLEK